jgi:hypothetical protein
VLPSPVANAQTAFEEDLAAITRAMSDEVNGKVPPAAPDVQSSADHLREVIHQQSAQSGGEIPPPLADMITLTQNLASIAAPLYADVRSTFENAQQAALRRPEVRLGEA